MTLQRFVPEGEMFPRGYGLAWRSWERRGCVCYPIPFNWLAAWAYGTWLYLEIPAGQRYGSWGYASYALGIKVGREMASREVR